MKEIRYKDFSVEFHKKNWRVKKPNACRFELTFYCELHCRHCYSDCYNKSAYLKKELCTSEIKLILDKVHKAGCIWLCLTGGDPLTRPDFLEIYSYAKKKGFIITIFTNGCSITPEIADIFGKITPFAMEITLNAVEQDLYEKMSGVKGSFKRAMRGIDLILKSGISLSIKTQITNDNLKELDRIRKFVRDLGLIFKVGSDLHARLNSDLTPCKLRISPQEAINLNGGVKEDCEKKICKTSRNLFQCAINGGDGIKIDPYGNIFYCHCIRKPKFNLLQYDIESVQSKLLFWAKSKVYNGKAKCSNCSLKELCALCPGKAYLETGEMEAPVLYYCELAKKMFEWR